MFTGETMTFAQSLITSGLGLATVFTCLVALSLAIMIFAKIFEVAGSGKKPAALPPLLPRPRPLRPRWMKRALQP